MMGKPFTFKSQKDFEKKHGKITGQTTLRGLRIIFTKDAIYKEIKRKAKDSGKGL